MGRSSMVHRFVTAIVLLAAAGIAAADDATPPDVKAPPPAVDPPPTQPVRSPAEQLAARFGRRIVAARATSADSADDLAVATEMATAAETAEPAGLRHLLAITALDLALPAGGEAATQLAARAFGIAMQSGPLSSLRQTEVVSRLSVRLFLESVAAGLPPGERAVRAKTAAVKTLAYVDALIAADQSDKALAQLAKAKEIAAAGDPGILLSELSARQKALSGHAAYLDAVKKAAAALAAAEAGGVKDTISAAQVALATVYACQGGDIPKAARFYAAAMHDMALPVLYASTFIAGPKAVRGNQLLSGARGLAKLSVQAHGRAKVKLSTVGYDMINAFLAGTPSARDAGKARVLKAQLARMSGQTDEQRVAAMLTRMYGPMAGKLYVLKAAEKRIRLTYAFARPEQLKDFITNGHTTWAIGPGGVLKGTKGSGAITHKVVFDAGKPIKVHFQAQATDRMIAQLLWSAHLPIRTDNLPYQVTLGMGNNPTQLSGPGGAPVALPRAKGNSKRAYRFALTWNGNGRLLWHTDGDKTGEFVSTLEESPRYMTLALRLHGREIALDNLQIEGAIIETKTQSEGGGP